MSQSGKLMPNLDQEGTKLLNLTVLQRRDPYIEEILMTAAHVTFYGFNIDLNQWSRKDVEGSLFVVKRNTQPRFQFIVMNRRSTENLVENLLGEFEYEIQVPYLLYRNVAQEVNGIWFYNARECEDVGNLFTRILSAYTKVSPKIEGSTSKSEFEELEAVSTSGVIEGPPEPYFAPSSSTAPEDSAFLNFFTTSTNIGNNGSSQAHHTTTTTVPLSSRLPNVLSHAQTPSSLPLSVSTPSFTIMPLQESSESNNNNNNRVITNLLKPSSFFMPAAATAPPVSTAASISTSVLHPPLNLQMTHSYGTPMLQPFPPPTPHISLTPNYGSLSREKVRDALHMLVQDNQFIEMFYQAMAKGNQ